MHHGGDSAYAVQAIEAENSLGDIGKANQHTLSRPYAQGIETAGYLVYLGGQAGVGCRLAHESEGREIPFPGSRIQDGLGHGFFAVIQIGCHLAVAGEPGGGHIVEFTPHK